MLTMMKSTMVFNPSARSGKAMIVMPSLGPLHSFCRWLKCYKSNTIKKTMLRSKRRQAGLGDPPIVFTTNASESINALLKRLVHHKKSDVPLFLDKLKDEQQRELERARENTSLKKISRIFEGRK